MPSPGLLAASRSVPSVPVLAGLLIEASDEGLVLSTFDYETSARATLDGRGQRRGPRPGQRPAARRHLPQPARQAGRDGARRLPGLADLRLGAVQPPDDAGRGLPDACPTCRPRPAPCRATSFAHAVAQAVTAAGRDDMLPVLTGVRIEIDGSTISLLATDRFRLSHRELDWNPRTPDESLAALVPGQGARRHRQVAHRRQRGHHRARRRPAPARASSASRARPPAACVARRPACSTASSPRSAACSRSEHQTKALVDKAALIESVKRVALVAERNTAVQLAFSDGVLTLDAGSGDEAQASESIEADHRRRGHHHRASTRSSSSTASARSTRPSSSWPSPRPPSRS